MYVSLDEPLNVTGPVCSIDSQRSSSGHARVTVAACRPLHSAAVVTRRTCGMISSRRYGQNPLLSSTCPQAIQHCVLLIRCRASCSSYCQAWQQTIGSAGSIATAAVSAYQILEPPVALASVALRRVVHQRDTDRVCLRCAVGCTQMPTATDATPHHIDSNDSSASRLHTFRATYRVANWSHGMNARNSRPNARRGLSLTRACRLSRDPRCQRPARKFCAAMRCCCRSGDARYPSN
jgi:hypothetical protein